MNKSMEPGAQEWLTTGCEVVR